MNKPIYTFRYIFHPVGQGLFASGAIHDPSGADCFRWVYDCGTISSQTLLTRELRTLNEFAGNPKMLHLVTLSHFDHDHISGIAQLIGKFKIKYLLLPYMPLWQRLLIAFEEGLTPGDDLMRFFVNPVEYLTGIEDSDITEILFVPPSGDEGPPYPGDAPDRPRLDNDDWNPDFEHSKPDDPEELEFLQSSSPKVRVVFLRKGQALKIKGCWEFIPYNDDPETNIPPAFQAAVVAERARLRDGTSQRRRNNALRKLKALYDKKFGNTSEQRNVISLFIYGGPLYRSWQDTKIEFIHPVPEGDVRKMLRVRCHFLHWPIVEAGSEAHKCSVLYTGDGYLDTFDKLGRLANYLKSKRIELVGTVQVMHHGAEGNWFKGVGPALSPLLSIFSSDPQRKDWGHPHAPVIRDFWEYGPVQVNKDCGVAIIGTLTSK